MLPVAPEGLELDPVLLALLQCAAFLDLSSDEDVRPEGAGDVLEHVGMYVQRLGDEELDELESQLDDLAEHGASAGWPEELVQFVASFLENCGIVTEDAVGDDDADDDDDRGDDEVAEDAPN